MGIPARSFAQKVDSRYRAKHEACENASQNREFGFQFCRAHHERDHEGMLSLPQSCARPGKQIHPARQLHPSRIAQHSMESGARIPCPLFIDSLDRHSRKEPTMGLVLLILFVLVLFGTVPAYPYSRGWGYQPMGFAGVLLAIILVLILLDIVPVGFGLHHPWYRPIAP
jgi:hypothetical protein